MNSLLNIVCFAVSIHYVFTAPTPAPKYAVEFVKQIIDNLIILATNSPMLDLPVKSLCINEMECASIEDVSCRAIASINAVDNKAVQLNNLQYSLKSFIKDVSCTGSTHNDQEVLENFIDKLRIHFENFIRSDI